MNLSPYTLHGNGAAHTGVILTSPHSGRQYPNDVLKWVSADMAALRKLEDPFVDVLLEKAITNDLTALLATYARCVVDLNRAANELDPKLIRFSGHVYVNSRRVQQGLGVIPRIAEHNRPLYHGMLPWTEARRRIEAYYVPFHTQLTHIIREAQFSCGQAIVLDFHSMPSKLPQGYGALADIVLGDMNGVSCSEALLQSLELAFHHYGMSVARNAPYAGGYIAHHYGQPNRNTHVVQIEINRSLYINEHSYELKAQLPQLQAILASVVQYIIQQHAPKAQLFAAE